MTEPTAPLLTLKALRVYAPDEDATYYVITGDLREIADDPDESMNYLVQAALGEGWLAEHPEVELDPEYSCFFGYAKTEGDAVALANEAERQVAALTAEQTWSITIAMPNGTSLVWTTGDEDIAFSWTQAIEGLMGSAGDFVDA